MTSITVLTHDHIEITMKVTGNEYAEWIHHFNLWLHFFNCFDLEEPLICNPNHFPVGYAITGYDFINSLHPQKGHNDE